MKFVALVLSALAIVSTASAHTDDADSVGAFEAYTAYYFGELANTPEVLVEKRGPLKVVVKDNGSLRCTLTTRSQIHKGPPSTSTLSCVRY